MNKNKISKIKFVTATLVLVFSVLAHAYDDDNLTSYDEIVRELTSSRSSTSGIQSDPLSQVKFHFGFGFISSRVELRLPEGLPTQTSMNGFEARGGIDLLSPRWIAEVAVRSYQPENTEGLEFSLREFDLQIQYRNYLSRAISYKFGAGMTSRYLDINGESNEEFKRANTTPASVFSAGLIANLTKMITAGPVVSYRNALVSDTADQGSLDGTLTVSGQF